MPSTLTILNIMINTESTPPGIRIYRQRQFERAIQRPFRLPPFLRVTRPSVGGAIGLLVQGIFLSGFLLAIVAGCMLTLCIMPVMVSFQLETIILLVYGMVLLIIGIGGGMIANGIRRQIARAQRARAWDLMLILPYARHEIVLGWAAQGFAPVGAQTGFLFVVLAGLMLNLDSQTPFQLLILGVLLTIEWLQLIALSVTVGLLSAGGRQNGLNVVAPIAYGLLLATGRAVGGALMVLLAGSQNLYLSSALIVGPLSGIAARTGYWFGLLLLGLLYLLALELLIRVLFAWGLGRLGEA